MKLKLFIALSIVLTIIYLITFPSYSTGFHAVGMILLFVLYLFTGKIAGDENKVDFKFRLWLHSMIIILLVLPIIIAPTQFASSDKIFRGISSLLILYDFFKRK